MHLILMLSAVLLATTFAYADTKSSEANEIDVKSVVSKFNPEFKKALLRAIENLEKKRAEQGDEDYEDEEEELLEESTVPDQVPSVQFYTSVFEKLRTNPSTGLIKSIINTASKQALRDNESKNSLAPITDENYVGTSTIQVPRSIGSNSLNGLSNEKQFDRKTTPYTTTTTVPTPTTSKKPVPTHNDDGENIEVVDKQDIKILEAPLVSAFTVQQDEAGTPKKVIPLINPTVESDPQLPAVSLKSSQQSVLPAAQPLVSPSQQLVSQQQLQSFPTNQPTAFNNFEPQLPVPTFLHTDILQRSNSFSTTDTNQSQKSSVQHTIVPSVELQTNSLSIQKAQSLLPVSVQQSIQQKLNNERAHSANSVFNAPNYYNNDIFERQKALEQQVLYLQAQARQQQEQILQQQQLLQEQQRKQFEEESRQRFQQDQNTNLLLNNNRGQNSLAVTLRPPPEILSSIQQSPRFDFSSELQLPVKEHIDFRGNNYRPFSSNPLRTSVRIQPSNEYAFTQQTVFGANSVPLELSSFQQLPQKSYQPFIPVTSSSPSDQGLSQRTRVFRQESGTGNFGVNNFQNNNNNNNNQNYFRQAFSPAVPASDHLQNLLQQSALNHGISSPYTQQYNLHYPGHFGSF